MFWATVKGVGKGAAIGGVAGGLIGATGGVVAGYGATSVAGTAMITTTTTTVAKAAEVTTLQARKSYSDGKRGWQIANDCVDSVFSNGGKIVSSVATKPATTSGAYLIEDIRNHKVVPLEYGAYLKSSGGKILPYLGAAYAVSNTIYAAFCNDPVARAAERGYMRK